jgi:salicylate biosynthesis isochorismate synthase/menaquinone-specific isochorismate synthase
MQTAIAPSELERAHPLLERTLRTAARRARRAGTPVLAAVTLPLPGDADPVAIAWASRQGLETLTTFEQPDRDGFALAGLGQVRALPCADPDRFGIAASVWRHLASTAEIAGAGVDDPASGLVALGGLAFAAGGGITPAWDNLGHGSLVVPEVSLRRARGRSTVTLIAGVAPDDVADQLARHLHTRLHGLVARSLPLLDPNLTTRPQVVSTLPPEHYEQAVAGAVEAIAAGRMEKIVLAREVEVHSQDPHDAAAVLGVLREAFGSCFVFSAARGNATFLGASPELLVRREGQRASTVALAGSTNRSADPAVDDHLGERLLRSEKDREEHDIVARRIERALAPDAVWVTRAPEPVVIRVANIQHLATPVRAQLKNALSALELAGRLHPTPAVGGEPRAAALALIPRLEGLDRGWYAGPFGWTDAAEDGEFCVALRSGLLRGTVARLFVGAGIVRESDPAAELAETEVKLGALLPVVAS